MINVYTQRFRSGKYEGKTYFAVWNKDKSYFHYLAENVGPYWLQVLTTLENISKRKAINHGTDEDKIERISVPTPADLKAFFLRYGIKGFDMSDFIVSTYNLIRTPEEKHFYVRSLLERNEIKEYPKGYAIPKTK